MRRVFDAVGRRDLDRVLALYDPEVEWDVSRHPGAGLTGEDVYRGHEGLRSLFRTRNEAWETIEDDCEELIGAGNHVISVGTTRGRGRASGIQVERTHYEVWTIRESKVVRVVSFASRQEALEAAGLQQ